jgi:hypothetical protein
MDIAARIAAFVFGAACVLFFFRSIIVAVFLDRPRHDAIARLATRLTRAAFHCVVPEGAAQDHIDRVLVWFWPISQFATIYAWYTLVTIGFAAVNWGSYASPDVISALISSGSSLSTLGFSTPPTIHGQIIAFVEAGIGLFIVVFLLTFIPGYLTAQQTRANRVARVYVRAGAPPTGAALVAWYYRAGKSSELDHYFEDAEGWIRDLGVSHSQSPGLGITRSYRRGEQWVSAVMAMLDAAAIAMDVLDGGPRASALLFVNAARRSLEDVAAAVRSVPAQAPAPSRAQFDAACEALAAAGAPVTADRDAAWRAFQATQDGYANLLVALARLTRIGPTTWQFTGRERAA